ncbi:MAG TPA: ectoine/hydroxyectoine ABC transporter permease subunit EhuD [Gammaproteobacteria bacterium]|nr:ectoine/hydroxyectoine ABC transporter permease subunit EhuD [Gammaproteobacteria bacterium]
MIWNWDYTWQVLPDILRAFGVTLQATLAGFALAAVLGLGWATARMSPWRWLAASATGIVEFVRSTPLLIQLYFLYYVLPDYGIALSPLVTGIIALGLHYSCYTAEVYRAGIEAVPQGQWEAARALNLSTRATWTRIILPQAIRPTLPMLGNYLIAMFKDTPLLAAITVMEMLQTAKLTGAQSFRYLEPLTITGVVFLVVSLLASWTVRHLETRHAIRR